MPQNPYPYVKTVVEDFTPGVPGSGTDVLAAHHNKQGDAAAYLINALPVWKVDPDNIEDCYATINAAYAAADAELPAGFPIHIIIASTKTHTLVGGVLNVLGTRSLFISINGDERPTTDDTFFTRVVGSFALSSADAASDRLTFCLRGFVQEGVIAGQSNWIIVLDHIYMEDAFITRTHGTNGCKVTCNTIITSTAFHITDSDTPSSASLAFVNFSNCPDLNFAFTGGYVFDFKGKGNLVFRNCLLTLFVTDNFAFINGANNVNNIGFYNTHIGVTVDISKTLTMVATGFISYVTWYNSTIDYHPSGTVVGDIDFDAFGNVGALRFASPRVPLNPFVGLEWHDTNLNEILIWDETDWGNNGVFRKDLSVGIGAAALDHDIGWNVPTGAAVVSTSIKLLKALTGAAGAVQVGLGTGSGGDPDKYAETASLASGQKDQNLHGTFNDGGGDDLKITAETAPGTSGGTVAGSGDEDVRVLVRFRKADVLP